MQGHVCGFSCVFTNYYCLLLFRSTLHYTDDMVSCFGGPPFGSFKSRYEMFVVSYIRTIVHKFCQFCVSLISRHSLSCCEELVLGKRMRSKPPTPSCTLYFLLKMNKIYIILFIETNDSIGTYIKHTL